MQQIQSLALAQPSDPFREIEDGLANYLALGQCQTCRGLLQALDRRLIQGKCHFGGRHTDTLPPYPVAPGAPPLWAAIDLPFSGFHAIAPITFGSVESGVGGANEGIGVARIR